MTEHLDPSHVDRLPDLPRLDGVEVVDMIDSDAATDTSPDLLSHTPALHPPAPPSHVSAAAASVRGLGKRNDVLADLEKSFSVAFEEWISLQGSDLILKDARYDEIMQTLRVKDARHARYRAWSAKYELVDLPNTEPYLVEQCDVNAKAKPRGANAATKRKSNEGVEPADSSSSAGNDSIHSVVRKSTLFVTKRVPRASEVEAIIAAAHGSGPQGSGHGGYDATYNKIRMTFTSISRPLVIAYIKRCIQCTLTQRSSTSKYEIKAIRTVGFWIRLQIDLFSFKEIFGIDYEAHVIQHVQCHFSKFALLRILPNKSAESVVNELKQIWCDFGPPDILQSDNGGEFVNKEMEQLATLWQYELINGAPYKPSTQGSVERNNGVARIKLIRSIAEAAATVDARRPFSERVQLTQWHLNSTVRRSHAAIPYQVVFNKLPRPAIRTQMAEAMDIDTPVAAAVLEERKEEHTAISDQAAAAAAIYQHNFVAAHNQRTDVKPELKAGDLVALLLRNPKTNNAIVSSVLRNHRELAVILKKDRASRYVLYTRWGILTEHQTSAALEVAAETIRPRVLRIDVAKVMEEYERQMLSGGDPLRISMEELIKLSRNATGAPGLFNPFVKRLYISKRALL